jgi:CBS domain-containing protein
MDFTGTTLKQLSREECLRLMGQVPVGRIVYTRQALLAVELVNFAMDDGDIVIRTDASGKLDAATRGVVVAGGNIAATWRVSAFPVLDEAGQVIGMVSESDLLAKLARAAKTGRRG